MGEGWVSVDDGISAQLSKAPAGNSWMSRVSATIGVPAGMTMCPPRTKAAKGPATIDTPSAVASRLRPDCAWRLRKRTTAFPPSGAHGPAEIRSSAALPNIPLFWACTTRPATTAPTTRRRPSMQSLPVSVKARASPVRVRRVSTGVSSRSSTRVCAGIAPDEADATVPTAASALPSSATNPGDRCITTSLCTTRLPIRRHARSLAISKPRVQPVRITSEATAWRWLG